MTTDDALSHDWRPNLRSPITPLLQFLCLSNDCEPDITDGTDGLEDNGSERVVIQLVGRDTCMRQLLFDYSP